MLVTSRSFAEYVAFFGLTSQDLQHRVLDCSAGASGFAAVAAARGAQVTAIDPAYALPRQQLVDQAKASLRSGNTIIAEHDARFSWAWYGPPVRRDVLRRDALEAFLADLRRPPGRYLAAALPALPLADRSFDLALCSHLLFTWSDQLDQDWHVQALRELLRVAAEVRVFPLLRQGNGAAVPFLPALLDILRAQGCRAELVPVDYEFQVGGNRMLRVCGPAASSVG